MRIEVTPNSLASAAGALAAVQSQGTSLRAQLGASTGEVEAATGHPPAAQAFEDLRSVWLQSVGDQVEAVGGLSAAVSAAATAYRLVDALAFPAADVLAGQVGGAP